MPKDFIENFINSLQGKTTKVYLIFANIILIIFAIWFSNVGLLPFSNAGDFLFFTVLALILAVYRPGWAFVLFIGALALENINLAPENFGLAVRPYQFFGALTIVALIVQIAMKRLPFSLPKFKWYDVLLIVFVFGGFLSSIGAVNKTVSLKQSVIALSFVALYFLTRVYVQSLNDLKRIAPFFLSGAIIVAFYGILQNILFIHGGNSFEVMPGRPNGTFAEADWLGIFLVFILAVIFTIIYYFNRKTTAVISNDQFPISNNQKIKKHITHATLYMLLILTFVSLILTVSRSSWLGAVLVSIGFFKIMLTNGSLRMSQWDWNKFLRELRNLTAVVILSLILIYVFHLTNFQIFNRAKSVDGLQKITVACERESNSPKKELDSQSVIGNVSELAQYGCRHINLEDIEKEKAVGNNISEIYRTDPNINIRSEIYQKSITQIRQNPIMGIGWGNINAILGTDERPARIATSLNENGKTYNSENQSTEGANQTQQSVAGGGAGFNASNIFLEAWLGAGLVGILSFIILLGYIFVRGTLMLLDRKTEDKTTTAFILLGWAAIVIPNLFNSGIFLGFVWVYLAIAISLIEAKE